MVREDADHFGRALKEGLTGEAAGVLALFEVFDALARDRGVRRRHGVHFVADEKVRHALERLVGEIGTDLDRDRHAAAEAVGLTVALGGDAGDEGLERVGFLQAREARGVRAGNVDGEIVGVLGELLHALDVVGQSVGDGRRVLLADVDPNDPTLGAVGLGAHEIFNRLVGAAVVEAHVVDDPLGGNEAPAAGLGIARLRTRRDRAHFDVAEAEAPERGHVGSGLVHPGGEPTRGSRAHSPPRGARRARGRRGASRARPRPSRCCS